MLLYHICIFLIIYLLSYSYGHFFYIKYGAPLSLVGSSRDPCAEALQRTGARLPARVQIHKSLPSVINRYMTITHYSPDLKSQISIDTYYILLNVTLNHHRASYIPTNINSLMQYRITAYRTTEHINNTSLHFMTSSQALMAKER